MRNIYLVAALILSTIIFSCEKKKTNESRPEENRPVKKVPPQIREYGYLLNDYRVVRDTIRLGDSFGAIMDANGVTRGEVFRISETVKDTFNPARIVAGKPYTILKAKDSSAAIKAFIYENDRINYTVVDLEDTIKAFTAKKPVTVKRKTASGVITSSLSGAMDHEGLSILLADKIADIYRWKIDFFKIQKGDQFKLIYNEKYINDTVYAGVENIEAAVLTHYDNPYYAFEFGKDSVSGFAKYYDNEANSLQSFFLKAPLKFSRISSRYTKRRFHPVQKRWKAHKGTDYAAPTGTPIWSTADGIVIKSSYTRGNGNYVKVRHNDKYTTQYLHMSKRNAKVGQRVKQGDVIGFVGQTGLATGPHVCYRFWVNGRQVDPYKQNLPSSEPLKEELKPSYYLHIERLKEELDSVPFKKIPKKIL
ncbi:peptidoglycan DD-metalloendopeptidase family protein [Mesonia aestuariivivens]|uniref:Peptidoglycan DD-metalloendopeptidase family protein n=1 Tax=Mesonia aestuariivivens TaxID=2796128 RepID=A0ABS6VXP1_9FLAO|nr:peptidoglycan DD-metalloendopeptidase family protein [Mesonia aestuariivivens]MBW2960340.1 peptidoglycan DD-metalloendopeptidase family protein [Mesonia aestuariivivens]